MFNHSPVTDVCNCHRTSQADTAVVLSRHCAACRSLGLGTALAFAGAAAIVKGTQAGPYPACPSTMSKLIFPSTINSYAIMARGSLEPRTALRRPAARAAPAPRLQLYLGVNSLTEFTAYMRRHPRSLLTKYERVHACTRARGRRRKPDSSQFVVDRGRAAYRRQTIPLQPPMVH